MAIALCHHPHIAASMGSFQRTGLCRKLDMEFHNELVTRVGGPNLFSWDSFKKQCCVL